jgi:riboflavin kinase
VARPHLTFVPGAAGLGSFWDPVRERLPPGSSHDALDWPGFDGSASFGVESYDLLIDHVAEKIRERGAVIGQSMGGFVALQLALRYPERVSHLVLTVAAAGVDMARQGALDWRSSSPRERRKPAWIYERVADLSAKLCRIRIPVLLLWATGDGLSPLGVAEQLRATLPDARLVTFQSDDHWFVHQFAEPVAAEIARHVELPDRALSERRLYGRVRSGMGNFSYWLTRLQPHYRAKTGMDLFPGTLNVELPEPYRLPPEPLRLEGSECGGTVSVNIVPCRVFGRPAFLLRTDNNEHGTGHHPRTIVEIATDVKLRDAYALSDGDVVELSFDV